MQNPLGGTARKVLGASAPGDIAGLALATLRRGDATRTLDAIKWQSLLATLGLRVPAFVAHDFGGCFAGPAGPVAVDSRTAELAASHLGMGAEAAVRAYANLVLAISDTLAAHELRALGPSDRLVCATIAKLVEDLHELVHAAPTRANAAAPLAPRALGPEAIFRAFVAENRDWELAWLASLVERQLAIATRAMTLDIDTLRLLGRLQDPTSTADPLACVDTIASLSSREAGDVAVFSLELLPAALDPSARRVPSKRREGGYASIGRRGTFDSLLLSELAWDDDELARRFADREILYHARESGTEESNRLHFVLIDASASMRGDRATFARGLAIALGKRLARAGDDVVFRFFDARLYEPIVARRRDFSPEKILAFKGEHGRDPSRVMRDLAAMLRRHRARDPRDPVVHLLTHAALRLDKAELAAVLRLAPMMGVFMMPSRPSARIAYADMLTHHTTVGYASLGQQNDRARVGTQIVHDTAAAVVELKRRQPGDATQQA